MNGEEQGMQLLRFEAQPQKISIALALRGHFTGQSSSRGPGRIEAES
jgi:hypothetical protein